MTDLEKTFYYLLAFIGFLAIGCALYGIMQLAFFVDDRIAAHREKVRLTAALKKMEGVVRAADFGEPSTTTKSYVVITGGKAFYLAFTWR